MTLAEAITQVHNGDPEGLRILLRVTAPNLWIAVSMLCSAAVGTRMTEVYRAAQETTGLLRSPSDLRLWLSRTAYPLLLEQPDLPLRQTGASAAESYRRLVSALPREERTVVLLLCSEGFSAAQAADVLGKQEIEVKRAMRRARTTVAQSIGQERAFAGSTVNTAWMLNQMSALREEQAKELPLFETVTDCVLTGTPFPETKPEPVQHTGFFQKLFRSRR